MLKLSSKLKGIFRVSLSNMVSLGLSMLTSFILPLFISVEQYGYWQLFILYVGYVGFFVLGFNDGIQLNYATYSYNEELAAKFHSFKRLLTVLTLCESILLILTSIIIYHNDPQDLYLSILIISNIFPTAIIGMFIYMNQSTLRFKEYAWCNIIDKIAFAILMLILIVAKQKEALTYAAAFTLSRYIVIIYCYYSSQMVFKIPAIKLSLLKNEIIKNFKDGFPLMIAMILGGPSIIVASRFLIEAEFGIEDFSSYSFALHTLVVAAQFITAISTVFYPIFKRCDKASLNDMYVSFDKTTTIFGGFLLLSYFPIALIIDLIYTKYSNILQYLYLIYPLFIYQCKVNVLVTNMYKVNNQPSKLILVNSIGIIINILCIYVGYFLFKSVVSIAIGTVIGYALWYYILQIRTYKTESWKLNPYIFADILVVLLFVIINLTSNLIANDYQTEIYYGFSLCLIIGLIIYLISKKFISNTLIEFSRLMKD